MLSNIPKAAQSLSATKAAHRRDRPRYEENLVQLTTQAEREVAIKIREMSSQGFYGTSFEVQGNTEVYSFNLQREVRDYLITILRKFGYKAEPLNENVIRLSWDLLALNPREHE